MKYVVFKKGEIVMPIIFHEHLNHCDIKAGEGWVPVSAGTCFFVDKRLVVDYKSQSVSLNLKPNRIDGTLMTMLSGNYGIMMFMDADDIYYPKVETIDNKRISNEK